MAKWDAPRSLYEMFGTVDPWVKKYVDNYKLNLITPDKIRDFSKFSSELGIVLECIQNSDDNHRLHAIMESQEKYRSVDVDTIELINTFTSTKISTKEANGGKIDMCKAIDDMIEEGRKEGRMEGRVEERQDFADKIKKLRASGMSSDQILKKVEQSVNRKPRTRKKP